LRTPRIKDDRVPSSIAQRTRKDPPGAVGNGAVLVACPDARPPAYEAVAGFLRAGLLDRFLTAYYDGAGGPIVRAAARSAARVSGRVEGRLRRRRHWAVGAERVRADLGYDLALAAQNRLGPRWPGATGRVARWRTRRFDRLLARLLRRRWPGVAFVFSDVASEYALPTCRRLGIASVLSMVHGDVREEREVIARESEQSADFFPIYLADGPIDAAELGWLHERRLRDIALADHILVPSDHIAGWLTRHGTPGERIRVVPYAADTRRFVPRAEEAHDPRSCTFLFAGGITQRKGIKYLLEAWRRVRRDGWRLQLLGGLPALTAPLEPYRDEVEWLGRVGHGEMPGRMASADVFVFPSLFEGSAVVTYEALACGLPTITTAAAGSVVRDGVEGIVVESGDVASLAAAIERLGRDPALREAMSGAARRRALEYDWPRYQAALIGTVRSLIGP
jgi:glycosyltransferase involved in cell wall biosynthesis